MVNMSLFLIGNGIFCIKREKKQKELYYVVTIEARRLMVGVYLRDQVYRHPHDPIFV